MILATKSGWLVGVTLLRETPKAYIVKAWDENREQRVPKVSNDKKLFECTDTALEWINLKR